MGEVGEIVVPKALGGWGLKNLIWFNMDLCAKSMWRALFYPGLWNKAIQSEYIKSFSLFQWVR